MNFYPEIKAHISPSALANWYEARSLFVKTYFLKEPFAGNSATRAGKQIHALIEAGLLEVKHIYGNNEETLTVDLEIVKVLGIPDSYGANPETYTALFVDYKSGKENTWDDAKLAGDLKMKTTAWLVWNKTGKPESVVGFIEYIPTQWNPATREVEPTGGESVVAGSCTYSGAEMEAFTAVIEKTVKEINEAYMEWLESTDEFVNQDDIADYAQLDQEIKEREVKMSLIKDRIADQMGMGGKETIPTPFGSFYFTSRKTYDYPATLKINYLDYGLVLEDAEKIGASASAAKKKYETEHDPSKVSKSLSFRAKK